MPTEPTALLAIGRALASIEPTVSPARAKQLRWVAGELRRALEREDFPADAASSLRALLAPEAVAAYLELADAQELAARQHARRPPSASSLRIRCRCLQLLADAAGVAFEPPALPRARPLPVADPGQRAAMWRHAATVPATRTRADHHARVRLGALVGVVLDTGARVGELLAMRTADLGPDLETLVVRRAPQHRDTSQPTEPQVCPLTEPTRRALRRWLDSRGELLAPHLGSDHGMLWVATTGARAKRRGGAEYTKLPGMAPISQGALIVAYRLAARRVNSAMAGTPGWEPIPTGLEQLRRSSTPAVWPQRSPDRRSPKTGNVEGGTVTP